MTQQILTKRLTYKFVDNNLLTQALTHRSYSAQNNERLEYLGDGALNFIIANQLYQRFPSLDEGDLSRLRAQLVKEAFNQLVRWVDFQDRLGLRCILSCGF